MNQVDYDHIFRNKMKFLRQSHLYSRCGLEVRSYFNYGPYADPRHNLPISIVNWRLPPGEQLKQNEHPNMDVIVFVLDGNYRQDNIHGDNIKIEGGKGILIKHNSTQSWHRDSNISEGVSNLIQIFYKPIQTEDREQSEIQMFDTYIDTTEYTMSIVRENNKSYEGLTIILNLGEKYLKINGNQLKCNELVYTDQQIMVEGEDCYYLMIKLKSNKKEQLN